MKPNFAAQGLALQIIQGCVTGCRDMAEAAELAALGHRLVNAGGKVVAIDAAVLQQIAPAAPNQAELLRAPEAARLIGVTRSTFWARHNSGRIPIPVRLSERCIRWKRSELMDWIAAGCPTREHWEKRNKRLDSKPI